MLPFIPDPHHRLKVEACHLKLHDTSFLIVHEYAFCWSVNQRIMIKMDRKKFIKSCKSGSDLGNCDGCHFDR